MDGFLLWDPNAVEAGLLLEEGVTQMMCCCSPAQPANTARQTPEDCLCRMLLTRYSAF